MKISYLSILLISLFFIKAPVSGQQYHATHGSPYGGAAGIFNNPASGVNAIYPWDLNLFSFQSTVTTNNILINDFSYTNPGNTSISFKPGKNSFYGHQTLDLNLFNFLYKIDEKHAFSIGVRGRMYNHFKSSAVEASDTITTLYGFFNANRTTPYLDGYLHHTGWMEYNFNYSQVLFENERSKLTGGLTLSFSKALSGAYAKINKMSASEFISGIDTGYIISAGGIALGYSNNYDIVNNGNNSSMAKDFLHRSKSGLGLSVGVEYSIYNDAATDETPHRPDNYAWKIGMSIMDLGKNKYGTSEYSGRFADPTQNINNAALNSKLTGFSSMAELKDSLKTLFNVYDSLSADFTISKPTRIILNVDRNLGNHFAINGQLNMNLFSTASYKKLLTRELNMITITPRWETFAWGFYLPVQYTTQGQLWVGAAIKLGPLTLGLHNIKWAKTISSPNGGGYLMLNIHPFNSKKIMSRFDCPE